MPHFLSLLPQAMLSFDQTSLCRAAVLGVRPETCIRCSQFAEGAGAGADLDLSPRSPDGATPVLLAFNPLPSRPGSPFDRFRANDVDDGVFIDAFEDGMTVFEAIEGCRSEEDVQQLQRLLEEEPQCHSTRDWSGRSPLGFAALAGRVQAVDVLISHLRARDELDLQLSVRLRKDKTVLALACEGGCLEIVQRLVDAGADILAADKANWTPLDVAAFHGHLEVVRWLLERGSEVHDTADPRSRTILHLLAEIKTTSAHRRVAEVAEALLAHCRGGIVDFQDGQLRTALHEANESNNCFMVKTLISFGADVNARDCRRNTPIFDSISQGHVCCVREMLKSKRINLNLRNLFSYTPLHIAVVTGHLLLVRLLVASGADPRLRARRNRSCAHLAARDSHFDVLRFLLAPEEGADDAAASDANARQWDDAATPLHAALRNHDAVVGDPRGFDRLGATVAALLRAGADAGAADAFGTAPATMAARKRLWTLTRLLILAGSDVDREELEGRLKPMFVVTRRKERRSGEGEEEEEDEDEEGSPRTRYIARAEGAAGRRRMTPVKAASLEDGDRDAGEESAPFSPQTLSISIPNPFEHRSDVAADKQWCVDFLFHTPLSLAESCRVVVRRRIGSRIGRILRRIDQQRSGSGNWSERGSGNWSERGSGNWGERRSGNWSERRSGNWSGSETGSYVESFIDAGIEVSAGICVGGERFIDAGSDHGAAFKRTDSFQNSKTGAENPGAAKRTAIGGDDDLRLPPSILRFLSLTEMTDSLLRKGFEACASDPSKSQIGRMRVTPF